MKKLKKFRKNMNMQSTEVNNMLNEMIDHINASNKMQLSVSNGQGSITSGLSGHRISLTMPKKTTSTGAVGINLFYGRTNQAWQDNGTVNVNPILSTGAEDTDNPVSVFIFADKSATNPLTGYWPVINNNLYVLYMRDKTGDYILVRPDVEVSGSCAT